MEDEIILTGYCRALDRSRMVTLELEDGKYFADCSYGNCPYEPNCTVARAISDKLKS